jgi:DNA helicase TIP49 (TBP-interacting protein)
MDKDLKTHITIRTTDEKEQMRVSDSIHHQLVGNKDYIDGNIILNIDVENEVNLYIFDECENVPDIII